MSANVDGGWVSKVDILIGGHVSTGRRVVCDVPLGDRVVRSSVDIFHPVPRASWLLYSDLLVLHTNLHTSLGLQRRTMWKAQPTALV